MVYDAKYIILNYAKLLLIRYLSRQGTFYIFKGNSKQRGIRNKNNNKKSEIKSNTSIFNVLKENKKKQLHRKLLLPFAFL